MSAGRAALGALVALLGASALGADCDPYEVTPEVAVYPLTVAPPGRVQLVQDADPAQQQPALIRLTRGVVAAVRCWETCEYTCTDATFTSDDPSVLSVRPLLRQGVTGSEFALVAVKTGATTVRLTTECATTTYPIEIVE